MSIWIPGCAWQHAHLAEFFGSSKVNRAKEAKVIFITSLLEIVMNNKQFQMKKIILSLAAGAVLGAAPALASAETKVDFGGDIIIRPFYRDNARDFNSGVQDTKKFTTERARLKANIKVDQDIGGVIEILHFRKWGGADPNRVVDANAAQAGAADDNWMDLNQAYIEVKNLWDSGLYMKAGRQEMAYGDQRLVGNTNFWSTYPFPRAYDALKVGAKYDSFDIDAWYATVVERQMAGLFGAPTVSTTAMNSDRMFSGVWATLKNIPDHTLDLYLLNMDDGGYVTGGGLSTYDATTIAPNLGHFPYQVNAAGAIASKTKVHNWGTRLKGKNGGLDYTVELNKQTGQSGTDSASISAHGGAGVIGYTFPDAMNFRLSGEYVFASGDDTPTSGDHKTFYQFSPSPHNNLGAQDFIAFQNIKAWRLGGAFNPKKNLKISADFWNFQLDKQQDSWYSSNLTSTRGAGAPFAASGAEGLLADKKIGTEIDLVANYNYSPALSFELGYSVFNPGTGIKNVTTQANLVGYTIGKGDSATFAWGMLMLKF
ncbi:MAG: alginate export family protein [Gallionella sp.]|nr:alginate export family protein [Gallionella sp.]